MVDYQRAFETVVEQLSTEYRRALEDYKRDAGELTELILLEGPSAAEVSQMKAYAASSRSTAGRLAHLLSTVEIMSDGTAGVPYDTSAAELRAVERGEEQ